MEKRPPQQMKVELTEPAAEGTYSNWVMISYGPSEFIIDFGIKVDFECERIGFLIVIDLPVPGPHVLRIAGNGVGRGIHRLGEGYLHIDVLPYIRFVVAGTNRQDLWKRFIRRQDHHGYFRHNAVKIP